MNESIESGLQQNFFEALSVSTNNKISNIKMKDCEKWWFFFDNFNAEKIEICKK